MKRTVSKTASFALCMAVICASAVMLFTDRKNTDTPEVYPLPCDSSLSYAGGEIDAMCSSGIMPTSNVDGRAYFYPTVTVTREYLAYVLARYLGISDSVMSSLSIGVCDENDISSRYLPSVRAVVHSGFMPIYDECGKYSFCPTDAVTRGQLADIISKTVNIFVSSDKSDLYADIDNIENSSAVDTAIGLNIMNGYSDGTFRPDENVTRQELAQIFYRLCEMQQGKEIGSE